jgi:predicted deacylase
MKYSNETENASWHGSKWHFGSLRGIEPGTKAIGTVQYGTYADGTPLQTVIHVIIGKKAGPILYIQAGVHGNEANGVEVIRRVISPLTPDDICGIVIAVPVVNGSSIIFHQRRNPIDGEDVNRVWPGKVNGNISQRIASSLFEHVIRHTHYAIDLHTAFGKTLPYVIYGNEDATGRKLAEVFGLEILLEAPGVISSESKSTLRYLLTSQGITTITPELGASDILEEDSVKLGVEGVTNVMKYLGMLEGKIVQSNRPQITLKDSQFVRANHGGIWVTQVNPGHKVHDAQVLGHIYSLVTFDIVERVTSPFEGYVLGTASMPIINAGDEVIKICKKMDDCKFSLKSIRCFVKKVEDLSSKLDFLFTKYLYFWLKTYTPNSPLLPVISL